MAKTFDNISEASATNYLFLFAQRTLALQNEPPTPPPLNVLGLPYHAIRAMMELPGWLQKRALTKKVEAEEEVLVEEAPVVEAFHLRGHAQAAAAAETEAATTTVTAAETETVTAAETETVTAAETETVTAADTETVTAEETRTETVTAVETETVTVAEIEETAGQGQRITAVARTFAEKIAPLAKQITNYILDHQDDAAQEDRWRTTMKRETMKCFREQREAIDKQCEAIDKQREEQHEAINRLNSRFDMQHEAIDEVRQLVNDVKNLANLANANQPSQD